MGKILLFSYILSFAIDGYILASERYGAENSPLRSCLIIESIHVISEYYSSLSFRLQKQESMMENRVTCVRMHEITKQVFLPKKCSTRSISMNKDYMLTINHMTASAIRNKYPTLDFQTIFLNT